MTGTLFGPSITRVGRSEAGRRIHAAGVRFQSTQVLPPPEPPRAPEPVPIAGAELGVMPDSARAIICATAARHDVEPAELLSYSRRRDVSRARAEAMYRCAAETRLSIAQIGRIFRRDHTSIGFAVSRHALVTGKPAARGMNWARASRKRRPREAAE